MALDMGVVEAVVEVMGTACQRKGMTHRCLGEQAAAACQIRKVEVLAEGCHQIWAHPNLVQVMAGQLCNTGVERSGWEKMAGCLMQVGGSGAIWMCWVWVN